MTMNSFLKFDGVAWWQVMAWTMLHYLWLGTLVAMAAAAARVFLRRASANVRYLTALTALALLALLPVGIAAWLIAHQPVSMTAVVETVPSDEIIELKWRETRIVDAP